MALTNMPQKKSILREAQRLHDQASAILETYAEDSTSPRKGNEAAMEALLTRTLQFMERECRALDLPQPLGGFKPY